MQMEVAVSEREHYPIVHANKWMKLITGVID